MEILKLIYFSVFFFAVIVFIDLVVKFKRPFSLKFCFGILILAVGFASYVYSQNLNPTSFYFSIIILKAVVVSAFLNIFSILYFQKLKVFVYSLSVLLISFTIFSLYYNYRLNPVYSQNLIGQTMVIVRSDGLQLPFILKSIRLLLIATFFSTMIYILYMMTVKIKLNNIYYTKIRIWTIFVFGLSLSFLVPYLPIYVFRNNEFVGHLVSIHIYLYILFIIFYRPAFFNKAALKIHLGKIFNREKDFLIKETDFILHFYTNLYFLDQDASLEHFAKKIDIKGDDLYKFIYNNYNMTFNDLINKNRIQYFIDIINNPKYQNYTIDALAREAGFSSRQHLYKPFKKFHGGIPSDIIEASI